MRRQAAYLWGCVHTGDTWQESFAADLPLPSSRLPESSFGTGRGHLYQPGEANAWPTGTLYGGGVMDAVFVVVTLLLLGILSTDVAEQLSKRASQRNRRRF